MPGLLILEGIMPEDIKLRNGKLIKWIRTPKCIKCRHWDKAHEECRLDRCRYKSKR